jgi:hypothetical protein
MFSNSFLHKCFFITYEGSCYSASINQDFSCTYDLYNITFHTSIVLNRPDFYVLYQNMLFFPDVDDE